MAPFLLPRHNAEASRTSRAQLVALLVTLLCLVSHSDPHTTWNIEWSSQVWWKWRSILVGKKHQPLAISWWTFRSNLGHHDASQADMAEYNDLTPLSYPYTTNIQPRHGLRPLLVEHRNWRPADQRDNLNLLKTNQGLDLNTSENFGVFLCD